MKKWSFLLLGVLVINTHKVFAQKTSDPVLFTYGNAKVHKSEFLRMYTKNINNQKPDFSEKALREYLTLYSRFKMKVAEAEGLRMDTLSSVESELGTYKKQLAKTYLADSEVTDKLVKEAYDRMKKDVRVSHILLNMPRNTDDTAVVFNKIDSIYKALQKGADFASIARAMSDDKPSASKGGDVGFFTGMQIPSYPFETAAYATPLGSFSKPFRTVFGYHIIKKTDERAARGEIQVSQIMINVKKSDGDEGDKAGKSKIDSILTALKKGANFEEMVELYSDDKYSKNTKGLLSTFGVGQMVPEFEDAAFALKKAGDLSAPVKTEFGYHIIKLVSKTPLRAFDSIKTDIKKKVEKDGRMEIAREQYIYKLKEKFKYKEDTKAITDLINAIPDSSLRNGTFKGQDYAKFNKNVFEIFGNTSFTQADFANYIQDYTRGKIYGPKEPTLRSLLKNYAEKALIDIQENKLIDENEEYRSLLTEYRDGIMLFELTDRNVWNKASSDSAGLEAFYNTRKDKYTWPPSVKGVIYKAMDEEYIKRVASALASPASNGSPDEVIKSANGDGVQNKVFYESGKFERSRFPAGLKMMNGKPTQHFKNEDGSYTIIDVKEVFDQPTPKTLAEARGYVISEYQEYLEKKWISDLEAKYPVTVNEATFKTMVK